MQNDSFENNEVLFGADTTEGIVALELVDDREMRLFIRSSEGITAIDEPFTPFLLVQDFELPEGCKVNYHIEPLAGDNAFKYLVLFDKWMDWNRAKSYVQRKSGVTASSPIAPYLLSNDPVHQFLLLSNKTLFKGLNFSDLHRVALDIETACAAGYEFSNPLRKEDRIISIALKDSRNREEFIFAGDFEERAMLERLNELIAEIDPDVIEGHNIFNFDLEYILARAAMHKISLTWGRDGSAPKVRKSRFSAAERSIDYTRVEIFGRHVVDTLFMLYFYDVSARELEGYDLKTAARHFGIAPQGRTYIKGKDIMWYWENDPDSLRRYNMDDVTETLALSGLLCYSFFLQSKIFPYSFQNIFVRGNATKINSLFLREYIRQRVSVPGAERMSGIEGGYTDLFIQGLVKNVVHCDVTSLYPSIMLTYEIKPHRDSLDIFLPLLKELKEFRIMAKRHAQDSPDTREREYYQALQQTFKILINSFYGYLGTNIHNFSDPKAASKITKIGRSVINNILTFMKEEGATPVELDTDGIYFVPPENLSTDREITDLTERLSASLPEGIELEMDGRFQAMFSYKMKNYALLDNSGKMTIKGAGLRSRGMERYLRDFLGEMIKLILNDRSNDVKGVLDEYMDRLEKHEIDISLLAKTETIGESMESYARKVSLKKRNPAAAYELAMNSDRDYRAGDKISYYVTGNKKRVTVYRDAKLLSSYDPEAKDENAPYYMSKLLDIYNKFKKFVNPQ